MEIIYAVDVKMTNDGEEFDRVLAMDVSCMNILAFSSYYLSTSSKLKYSPHLVSTTLQQAAKSSFCVYVCSLEQPWHYGLIATSIVPIVHLVWSLDGIHLLVCNQTGLCRIFKMKNGCINTMDNIYQYEINEDILNAKYIFHKEPIVVNLDRKDSLFYGKEDSQSSMLPCALNAGNFICVTTSGTIHTLPLNRSLPPYRYFLSQNDPLSVSLCDISATDKGFNVILGERTQGALVHFFVVHYEALDPKLSYISCRRRGFRIPSCYGTLESLLYFQRNGNDCILARLSTSSGDLIDLYEYNLEQEEWISITLLNSPQAQITSIALSPSQLLIKDNDFQGHFGRQILVGLSDGSILVYDKLNLKCKEQSFPMSNADLFMQTTTTKAEYLVRIQHTNSGSCCLGFTQSGVLILLRTISLDNASTSAMLNVLVHLFEEYIVQSPTPVDLWDILCLISNPHYDNATINELIDQLVTRYDEQPIELKRNYFARFKQCLYHLHRLASPFSTESCEHLTSLLVYHILIIVRDYLRLFIYEPTNRNFVDSAQEILQQTLFIQNVDIKRIKYLGDQPLTIDSTTIDPKNYQLISFTSLINWISDIIFYLIGYLQLQQIPQWLSCKHLFNDSRQIQWLREFIIYFYILNKMNKIPYSKLAHIQPISQTAQTSQDSQQQTNNLSTQKDILKDLYNCLSKLNQKIDAQKSVNFDESLLEDFSVLDIEMLQSKVDDLFPKPYPFLIQNSRLPQTFIRGQPPSFAAHLYGSSATIDTTGSGGQQSSYSSTLLNDDNLQDFKLDIIALNKMSLSSSPTFRRCLRCSNFSRVFKTKPYPFLAQRLNNRCLCGGLFLFYTRSSSIINNNNNSSSTEISTTSATR
ncbi:unnamed protein product [Rotaria socialis]|uniref:Mediator of RNA polymerase II transcription subunit 16 central helical bridge domain-containing protein n=1 Tax=Rotaria socialis TaxID=392032 RepID=A0A817RNM6_9BILA|nr:unnamed protein product [Rotaria socialis]CAF3304453.1 unnamed protein product [Rotaria socialis]CAF3325110.1 unnamed protein product [Rotaria socialis]CAF4244376.1 unnamed protein product [Rotaria socialis]CAF4785237.1 unnamed protein product [Rotaria socialis]